MSNHREAASDHTTAATTNGPPTISSRRRGGEEAGVAQRPRLAVHVADRAVRFLDEQGAGGGRPERTALCCQKASIRPAATWMSCRVAGTETGTVTYMTIVIGCVFPWRARAFDGRAR